MKKIALLLLLATSFGHAQNWSKNKIEGNGKVVSQVRSTSQYDEIITNCSFLVELISGPEGQITLTGDENLLELIHVTVENNALKIGIEKGIWFDTRGERIKITVPFEKISRIDFGGSGDLKTNDKIVSENLEIHVSGSGTTTVQIETLQIKAILSGSGTLEISGTTVNFDAKLSGSGGMACKKLLSQNSTALLSGSGHIDLNCSESLHAKVSGSGGITYSGNPKYTDNKVSGSGEILSF